MFYNGLTSLDGTLTPQPSLAEEFSTKDAKTCLPVIHAALEISHIAP